MAASGAKTIPTIGFLTVVENSDSGWVGGLLVLNAAGRPLEFHCTAPVKPNRAQEILYGPTLRPFLYGEQIGQTLLSKVKSETLFVCTDVEPALCVREFVSLPVVLVQGCRVGEQPADQLPSAPPTRTDTRIDAAQGPPRPATSRLAEFCLGPQSVAVLADFEADRDQVVTRWQPYRDYWDLREPFARVREALEEAQRGAAK